MTNNINNKRLEIHSVQLKPIWFGFLCPESITVVYSALLL